MSFQGVTIFLLFRVKWRLKDIDWPTCMSYIEFVYYDTVYNESIFVHTYDGPFVDKMEFQLLNTQVKIEYGTMKGFLSNITFHFLSRFPVMRSTHM